ncbi:hypothetical protein [Azonexus hydrophilus]|jgi:hypothetical protein|uniref:hypothetical protein n=1 Tax=Azonexus hydrophilus TaxID=418702 RepID=UPI001BC191B3|nr:hypothetical protein [Azonexus hydrophilus]MBS4016729.1 hypothetical protein [Dechloromonas sp.]
MNGALVLDEAWRQCQKHLHHLRHAMGALAANFPVKAEALAGMDDETVQDWDQFILRFTKLQDAMGGRLYPALLDYLQEPYDNRPMLDKLNRLEQLGFLGSIDDWNTLRVIRNHFAHDYPEDDAVKAAFLNQAAAAVPLLESLLKRVAAAVPGFEA